MGVKQSPGAMVGVDVLVAAKVIARLQAPQVTRRVLDNLGGYERSTQ